VRTPAVRVTSPPQHSPAPMRLYRLEVDCRKCEHRYQDWVSEAQRLASMKMPTDEVWGVKVCPRPHCGSDIPIMARHVREAWFSARRTAEVAQNPLLRNLRLRPELAPPPPQLTSRQAKICALVVKGMTDRKIAATLHVGKPTVRKEIERAAHRLCVNEPVACRVFPRQTIVAYYQERAGNSEPEQLFKIAC
jgi:DNA-binding CsgD family transcriptional regulator